MYRLQDITNEELLSTVLPEARASLQSFKDLKTYKEENYHKRIPGLQNLVNDLIRIYNVPAQINVVYNDPEPNSPVYINDYGLPVHKINLVDRISIISLLCAFARIKFKLVDETDEFIPRQRLAINLFRVVYPTQFDQLEFHPAVGGFSKPGTQLGWRANIQGEEFGPIIEAALNIDVEETVQLISQHDNVLFDDESEEFIFDEENCPDC
jgi:hypothetical protein